MPKVSDRQQCLKWVRENLYLSILMESSGDDDGMSEDTDASSHTSGFMSLDSDCDMNSSSDSEVECNTSPCDVNAKPGQWFDWYTLLDSERYYEKRCKTPRAKEFADTFFRSILPLSDFRQICRMDKEGFFARVELIELHLVYHNNSSRQQAPVSLQLATCLDRLGHSGNGVCLKRTLLLWGVSVGSCVNYTTRTVTALEAALGDYLQWPQLAERLQISEEFAKRGFHGCVGLIDGTTMPLAQRPKNHGECYFDRKSRYSINAQIVCDHNRKITFLNAGMTGSCSDLTCLKRTILWDKIHGDSAFDVGQYVLGDSGYVNAPHMVAAYKNTYGHKDKEDFNFCIAKTRYINEHCIGVVKSRWFSLKEIRTQLNEKKDSVWMCRWIRACCLLHNFVVTRNDEWTEEDMTNWPPGPSEEECPGSSSAPVDMARNRAARAVGRTLQMGVMARALAFARQPGGALWDLYTT